MNRRILTILVIAFIIACACAFLVYRVINNRQVASKPVESTRVLAAATDIKLGSVIGADKLTTIEIVGPLPKGALLKPENAIGRGVISDIYRGEPILENRLAASGSGGGLAATIPRGMRACAVKVDDVVGVAGFVTPGMHVDVLISGTPPGAQVDTQGTVSRTILQNIAVLSAGTDIQKDAEGKPKQVQVVNLLVTPEQAESLSLAGNQVRIQLVLRNPMDTEIAKVPGTAMGTLFASQNAAPASPRPVVKSPHTAAKRVFSVEVINGSKRTEQTFSSPGGKQ
jgi:pilus assembly protein CpaB